ncbi:MEDS domain-containing protein [Catellatospora bangladeshensis]|uniref:MEDS domain-containing protein n=1 Tax=Catellatospora bangladeshensis TaxID=310355 RepID=UPI00362263A9
MADAVTVDELHPGDHACLTFTDPDERLDLVAEFVADGLHRGQRVICFTDSLSPDELAAELAMREVAAVAAIGSGQLTLYASHDAPAVEGGATAERMVALIAAERHRAARRGVPGLRVAADMCWAGRPMAVDQLLTFERQAASLFTDGRLTAICQYDRETFDAVTLAFAADAHHKTIAALAYHDTPLLRICRQHRPAGCASPGRWTTRTWSRSARRSPRRCGWTTTSTSTSPSCVSSTSPPRRPSCRAPWRCPRRAG